MQIQTVKGNAEREGIANRQGTRLTIRIRLCIVIFVNPSLSVGGRGATGGR